MLTYSVFEKEPLYVNVPDPSRSEDTASDMNNNIHDNQHGHLFEEASIPKDEHSQTLQQINHLQSKLRSTPLKVVDRKGISSKIEKLNEKLNPKFQESVNDQVSSTNAQSCQNQRHKAVSLEKPIFEIFNAKEQEIIRVNSDFKFIGNVASHEVKTKVSTRWC